MFIGLAFVLYWSYDLFGYYPPEFSGPIFENPLFFTLIYGISFVFLDTVIVAIFGSSPGKTIMGLRLKNVRETPLTLGRSLRRASGCYLNGIGLNIPIITLIGHIRCGVRLHDGYPLSWEAGSGLVVQETKISWLRWTGGVLFTIAWIAFLIWLTYLNAIEQYQY